MKLWRLPDRRSPPREYMIQVGIAVDSVLLERRVLPFHCSFLVGPDDGLAGIAARLNHAAFELNSQRDLMGADPP